MASRPRQRPSTTEKPTMTFSVKPRLICISTKTTGLNEHSANETGHGLAVSSRTTYFVSRYMW